MGGEGQPDHECDLLVIGGGINGAGIARDASGRGLKVVLCERNDLASGTSSVSSKLIHGGLRYLEHYEFRLVREALAERETLLRIMPHIAWPLRFVLPHNADLRPAWMIRIGLFLYDHLAARSKLDGSHQISLRASLEGAPLKGDYDKGFIYSDCWVDDARLVVLNAMDAAARGATILTRTACVGAERKADHWLATLTDDRGESRTVRARAVVNAAGPWVAQVQKTVLGQSGKEHLRLVQGSHIVVPKLYEGAHAYILQNPDKRIVFVIPYEGQFTLIGTTDVPYAGNPAEVRISKAETEYLCASVSRYFEREIAPADVVWSYAGVRPLYDDEAADPASVTRDYVLEASGGPEDAPLLTIYGGKLTTYRRLAEHAMEKLGPLLEMSPKEWTGSEPLPGGDMPDADFDAFLADFRARNPWLPEDLSARYAHSYGTRARLIVDGADSLDGLGQHLGGTLYEREAEYLVAHEWARSADDILLRRSKLALHGGKELKDALEKWLRKRFGDQFAT
ncbi:glycerol-3-phosphate dehydrogenase [Aquabacter sp. CN5-332]|uniref:glycerol-3-phosphate dehydrogenase n=1 Tax=Aquabacter sp. CN5-332 TaxID=3156608 RepID=UPI0032B425C9